MYTVTTTWHSGKTRTVEIKDSEMTDKVLAELETIAMNGYKNVASCEVKKDGKVVMYGEN